jgi:hypothetical protein
MQLNSNITGRESTLLPAVLEVDYVTVREFFPSPEINCPDMICTPVTELSLNLATRVCAILVSVATELRQPFLVEPSPVHASSSPITCVINSDEPSKKYP